MSEADLVEDFKSSIQDAKLAFTAASDADYKRILKVAALDFHRKRGRTLVGSITLVADQARYSLPASFAAFKSSLWGIAPTRAPQPWEKGYPGRLPDARLVEDAGERKLELFPPPTAAQIAVLGSEWRYYYYAAHAIGATEADTTILAADRALLILRAQAEAMREMAMRNIVKPTQLRDGISGQPRNGTPAYLYGLLMREFEAV